MVRPPARSGPRSGLAPDRLHPAYEPLYQLYKCSGGAITPAYKALAAYWDDAAHGPLPDLETTVRKWVAADGWERRMLEEVARDYRGLVGEAATIVLAGMPAAARLQNAYYEPGTAVTAQQARAAADHLRMGIGIAVSRMMEFVGELAPDPYATAAIPDAELPTAELLKRDKRDYQRMRQGRDW